MFESANDFSLYIEKKAVETSTSCLDVLVEYCEENMLEYGDIGNMITPSLKAKLHVNFEDRNYIKKRARLQ